MSVHNFTVTLTDKELATLRYALDELAELLKSPTSADRDADPDEADADIDRCERMLELFSPEN